MLASKPKNPEGNLWIFIGEENKLENGALRYDNLELRGTAARSNR